MIEGKFGEIVMGVDSLKKVLKEARSIRIKTLLIYRISQRKLSCIIINEQIDYIEGGEYH